MTLAHHERWAFPLAALLLGACLFLPGIGQFGLWEPHEIRIAEQARDVLEWSREHGFDVTAGGKHPERPPLTMWLVSRSIGVFGLSETGARLPFAFMAILGLLATYFLGATLFGRRTGLIAAGILACAPGYILQARQLVSDTLLVVPSTAWFLGAVLLLWPKEGRHTPRSLAVGLVLLVAGLGIAFLAGGALLGVVIPLGGATLGAVLALPVLKGARGAGNDEKPSSFTGPQSLMPLYVLGALALLVTALTAYHAFAATRYSPLVGGIPLKSQGGMTWDYFLKQVGFAFFPMSALAPFAFGRLLFRYDPAEGRVAFGKMLIATWAVLAFFLATLWVWRYGQMRFPALPALALGVAVVLDELLGEHREGDMLLGFGVALVAAIFARDLFLYPEYLAAGHVLDTVGWPEGVGLAPVFVALGLVFAAFAFGAFALGARFATLGRVATWGVFVLTLATSTVVTFVAIPALSKHFSQKVLFDRFQTLRKSSEPLAHYRAGQGVKFYTRGQTTELPTLQALLDFLRTSTRVFAVIPAEELGQIDQQARASGVSYAVVDATSSRFLLVSNQLGPGETDKNPLRALVRQTPPTPQNRVEADFDGKIMLLGYDLPRVIRRGERFTVTLHFHVKEKPPAGYKIFLHFDGPGTRFNGDHPPLDGKFPTQLWSPGDYISDPYVMMAERATTPRGQYTLWMGFWPGGDGKRLPVVAGPSDGNNRVRLGTVTVE